MVTVEVVSATTALHEEKIEEPIKPQQTNTVESVPEEPKETDQAVAEPAPEAQALAIEVETKAVVVEEAEVTPVKEEAVEVVETAKVAPEPEPEPAVLETAEAEEEPQVPKFEEEIKPTEAEEKVGDETAPAAEKAEE